MASHVYVMGVGTSADRVRPLVKEITARSSFTVFVDASAGGAADYYAFHGDAAVVVQIWGDYANDEIPYQALEEIRQAFSLGNQFMIVVKLDAKVEFPPELSGVPVVDLSSWTGDEYPEFRGLMDRMERIVNMRLPQLYGNSLTPWFVERAETQVDEISRLVERLGQLNVVLAGDDIPMEELSETLRELGETYRTVKKAIKKFMVAGHGSQGINKDKYLSIERAKLTETIHNSRAHCGRIGARYYREGGIRQTLESRVKEDILTLADTTFNSLTHADFDMLSTMDDIGTALTIESRSIVNLLENGAEVAAQERISQARKMLLPLEDKVEVAVKDFQKFAALIGWADDRVPKKKEIHMTIGNVNIGGNNVNCNIVVADIIKQTSMIVSASEIPNEVRKNLENLEKAVAELTTQLSNEDAEFAATQMQVIAKQATSGQPNSRLLKDATKNLLQVAKEVAEAGRPVIDLVAKVMEFLN